MTIAPTSLTLDLWLEALVASTIDLADGTLGWYASPVDGAVTEMPVTGEGSYLPMFTEDSSVQLGLTSSAWGAQVMAKALLGMEADEPDLPEEDLADCIGEIVNILAGAVKSRLIEHEPSIRLGLPMYVAGSMRPSAAHEVAVRELALGPVRASLVVLANRS